ncbi:MAG: hypothetical protein JW719_10690 [Pirellulales bacterium]|nr:hypothetical protein [Pirellulales bacterium]
MDEASLNSRLSRISTIWGMLTEGRDSLQAGARDARLALIQRYQGAVYRYLLGAVRNPDVADDLFQEFALRCLQGAFRRVAPQRGRFRDYLKTTLYHLIVDCQKRGRRGPRALDTQLSPAAVQWDANQSDLRFLESWREELLARAWAVLAETERHGGQPFHAVLRLRADHPEASSAELTAAVNKQTRPDRPYSETTIRKMLQRARARFADALLDEVAHSLGSPAIEGLEQELIDLDLLVYCRSALDRRKQALAAPE